MDRLEAEIQNNENRLREVEREIETFNQILAKLNNDNDRININSLEQELSQLKREKDEVDRKLNSMQSKKEKDDESGKLLGQRSNLKHKIIGIESEINKNKKLKSNIKGQIDFHNEILRRINRRKDELVRSISNMHDNMRRLERNSYASSSRGFRP